MKSKDLRLLLSQTSSRRLFFVALIGSLVSTFIVIAHGFLLGATIVGAIYRHPSTPRWLSLLAALWISRALFTAQFEFWCSSQASKIKSDARRSITSNFSHMEIDSYATVSNLLVKGLNSLDIYLGRFLPQLFSAMLTPLAVIAAIYFLDPLSAVIAIVTLPLIPFFGAFIGKYTSDSVERKWRSLGTLSQYFEDSLKGFVTLRIFGRHRTQAERIAIMGDKYTAETMQVLKISFLSALVLELAATISVALIAVSIGLRLVDGNITFIHGLTVLILAPEVYFPMRNAASLFHASADGTEVLRSLDDLKKGALERTELQTGLIAQREGYGWADWTLKLPNVETSWIAANHIDRGEMVFLVGDSGIGKTSFSQSLISEDPEISWIPQHPRLAPGTVRSQFLLVKPKVSDAEISEVLARVGLTLADLPFELESKIGGADEKSSEVSGGQLRKIAIARALIRQSKFIVADEPTADLDEVSERVVMSALRQEVKRGAAVLVISHDRSLALPEERTLHMQKVAL